MKTVQYFSDDYLARCKEATSEQIIEFLNDFMALHTRDDKPEKPVSFLPTKNVEALQPPLSEDF